MWEPGREEGKSEEAPCHISPTLPDTVSLFTSTPDVRVGFELFTVPR